MSRTGSFRDLADWLSWLETLSPAKIVLGLDRVEAVLGRLDVDPPGTTIHVAGTNGKGSSVAMLEALLLSRGESVGCYTSPHVLRFNERIRVGGGDVDDDAIIAAFERIESARMQTPLTYFEFSTLAALVVFEARSVDIAILEVGMGGRLDAVNATEPDAGLITNVSLDHSDWLGADIETIAVEKAGIMRPSKPLVFGSRDVPDAIRARAKAVGADLKLAGTDFEWRRTGTDSWSWQSERQVLDGLATPDLIGEFQLENAAAVLALAEAAGRDDLFDAGAINEAWSVLRLPGRLQFVDCGGRWLLDVAHNGAAAGALAAELPALAGDGRVLAVIGVLDDKDVESIVQPLLARVDGWIAVTAASVRGVAATELARRIANASNKPCLIGDDLGHALAAAAGRAGDDGLVLVTGSFYVVGPTLDELYSRREGGVRNCGS